MYWFCVCKLTGRFISSSESTSQIIAHIYVTFIFYFGIPYSKPFFFNLRRMLWVKNYPHLWLLPHNFSSLWGNAMKFYEFVNEGLVPVLTKFGVSGWINIRVKKQTKLYKTLSTLWVCAHPYSHCRTLARHTSWVWRHPCFAKERNLSPARHTSRVWRHPCFLKGWNRIFSLCACTLSSHFTMVICWHRTLFLLLGGGGSGFDGNSKSSAVCN